MSQTDLAAAVGVALTTVSAIERGRPPKSPNIVSRLAEVLGVSAGWLMGEGGAHLPEAPAAPGGAPEDPGGEGTPPPGYTADYWRGRQDALLELMEHINEMQSKAIQAQRQIIANTVPVPKTSGDLPPGARDALERYAPGMDAARQALEKRRA